MFSKEFILLCVKQDRKALNELFELIKGPLMALACRYNKDIEEAKSLVNQSFVQIVTNLDKYNPDLPFMSWAKKVSINLMINEFHKKNGVRKVEMVYTSFERGEFSDELIELPEDMADNSGQELVDMVNNLPPTTAKVFNLFALDGYKHEEVAKILGITSGASRWHVSNARILLKEMLEKRKTQIATN